MADLKDMTVTAFTDITASDAPAPGGGSVAALAGALSAALAAMVCHLTVGKKGYEDVSEEMKKQAAEAESLKDELLAAIDKDSNSFNDYMAALKLPKETEEEKALRLAKMQEGLKAAASVPLEAAECAMKIFPYAEAAVKKGNKNAVTDGLVSAMLARTAVLGALLNTKINLASIRDEAFVRETGQRVAALEQRAVSEEANILRLSELTKEI